MVKLYAGGIILIDDNKIIVRKRNSLNDGIDESTTDQGDIVFNEAKERIAGMFKEVNEPSDLQVLRPLNTCFCVLFDQSAIKNGKITNLDSLTLYQSEVVSMENEVDYFNALCNSLILKGNISLTPIFLLLEININKMKHYFYLTVMFDPNSFNIRSKDVFPMNQDVNNGGIILY